MYTAVKLNNHFLLYKRIISARKATKIEKGFYEKGI
jgi:hypothetical protein